MKPDKDCPECGARKIHHTVSVCEVCETWAKAERQIACLEREVARLREGEECHVARPGEGTYECRHDNLCAACRLRSAEARANRATHTVGETEWAMRIANAEQRFVDEYDRRKASSLRNAMLEERALTAEERLERVTRERDQERTVFEQENLALRRELARIMDDH